jgi:hypothetical protein
MLDKFILVLLDGTFFKKKEQICIILHASTKQLRATDISKQIFIHITNFCQDYSFNRPINGPAITEQQLKQPLNYLNYSFTSWVIGLYVMV